MSPDEKCSMCGKVNRHWSGMCKDCRASKCVACGVTIRQRVMNPRPTCNRCNSQKKVAHLSATKFTNIVKVETT